MTAAKPVPLPPPPAWFCKSEPSVYSVADLKQEKRCRWDGVRNYLARNFLRQARIGDGVAFWHSNTAQAGVAGFGRIVKSAYPDPTALDPGHPGFDPKSDPAQPRWFSVDVAFVSELTEVLPVRVLKDDPAFADLLFFRQNRLSVCPAQAHHWKRLQELCEPYVKGRRHR